MKKIALILLLPCLFANTVFAATTDTASIVSSIGINYSLDNVFGTQFEFDISKIVNKQPISLQLLLKNYSQRLSNTATWSTTGIGVAGIYDLTLASKFDKKIHPYVGLGLIDVFYTWSGSGIQQNYNGVSGGLYAIAGVRYSLGPQIDTDINLNNFGGLTCGVNFDF